MQVIGLLAIAAETWGCTARASTRPRVCIKATLKAALVRYRDFGPCCSPGSRCHAVTAAWLDEIGGWNEPATGGRAAKPPPPWAARY